MYPQDLHSKIPVFNTANFSSNLRLSNFSGSFGGGESSSDEVGGSRMGCSEVGGLSSLETSMDLRVNWGFACVCRGDSEWVLRWVCGNVRWGFGFEFEGWEREEVEM